MKLEGVGLQKAGNTHPYIKAEHLLQALGFLVTGEHSVEEGGSPLGQSPSGGGGSPLQL